MERPSGSRISQNKTARIRGIVTILLDDLTGFDNLQDFFDVNTAQRLFVHLISSVVCESAISRTSTNFSLIHLSVVPVLVRKRQRRKPIRRVQIESMAIGLQGGGVAKHETAVWPAIAEKWGGLGGVKHGSSAPI
jgi:hypothetical protein